MKFDFLRHEGITSSRVIEALEAVPRDRFVPESERASAFENRPLAIGYRQTISQPTIVAYMTQELDIRPGDRVLEIGTGSGYQTAILAELAGEVFSVEIVRQLADRAQQLLRELGYENVHTRVGNGREGWPEEAPFDEVIVTAAGEELPETFIDQLAPEGRLIAPVGPKHAQVLVKVTKEQSGRVRREELLPVRFVPLTGSGQ
ncbi:MAG: protein-L-isoaspartate(D-aspartate) O-methyltransferase [Spirochaetales bacterium]